MQFRGAQSKWLRAGCAAVAFILLALVVLVLGVLLNRFCAESARRERDRQAMRQIFLALEQYAEASAGNYYPMRSPEPGVFLPDMDEWAKIGDGMAEFEEAFKALTENDDRPLCYLGYAFVNEALAQQLLDQLEREPQALRGGGPSDLEVIPITDSSSPETDEPQPMRKGVGRRFMWRYVYSGYRSGEEPFGYDIPLLWQMPRGEDDHVLVLRQNGVILTHSYPGEFPMSPLFINRLREMIGLPQDTGFTMDAPILPLAHKILEMETCDGGRGVGSLVHFDVEPSVTVGDARGYRLEFIHAGLVLFPDNAHTTAIPAKSLFEPPDDKYCGMRPRAIRYMGAGSSYRWYGTMAYDDFLLLQEAFGLTGGEGLYNAAARYCVFWEPVDVWLRPWHKDERKPSVVCEAPSSLANYAHAYLAVRNGKRRAVSQEIIDAAMILCGSEREGYGVFVPPTPDIISEAKDRLVASADDDPEGAATLAILYAIRHTARGPRIEATPDKIEFLRRLPQDTLIPIVRHLAVSLQDSHEAGLCKDLLKQLAQ